MRSVTCILLFSLFQFFPFTYSLWIILRLTEYGNSFVRIPRHTPRSLRLRRSEGPLSLWGQRRTPYLLHPRSVWLSVSFPQASSPSSYTFSGRRFLSFRESLEVYQVVTPLGHSSSSTRCLSSFAGFNTWRNWGEGGREVHLSSYLTCLSVHVHSQSGTLSVILHTPLYSSFIPTLILEPGLTILGTDGITSHWRSPSTIGDFQKLTLPPPLLY